MPKPTTRITYKLIIYTIHKQSVFEITMIFSLIAVWNVLFVGPFKKEGLGSVALDRRFSDSRRDNRRWLTEIFSTLDCRKNSWWGTFSADPGDICLNWFSHQQKIYNDSGRWALQVSQYRWKVVTCEVISVFPPLLHASNLPPLVRPSLTCWIH